MQSGRWRLPSDNVLTLVVLGITLALMGFLIAQQLASPDATRTDLLLIHVICACLAISIAASRLIKRISATEAVEQRLLDFGQSRNEQSLTPILDSGNVGSSWNTLVELLSGRLTDQKIERRIEQAVSPQGTERFARALRSLPEGLCISDRHGKVMYANPAWQVLMGCTPKAEESLVGKLLGEFLAGVAFSNWHEVSPQLLDGTKPIQLELRFGGNLADGVLQLGRAPLEGRQHEAEGFVWTLRDVTQHALAREAHEQFLSAATHELRTPLTNIKAYSESLIETEDISPQQQREFFNVIHSEANRLGRLLNQLLDIQQLEAGSMTVSMAAFDVQRMVQEVQEHIAPLVSEKQLRLSCRIAPNLGSIQADKEKIISCLVNLLGNAVKYTPEGGDIRLLAELQDTSVVITVEDTGIGIAEDELPKIFERFYRCQDERIADVEGNGLGLAFAMEVARLHAGELKVESQIDKGSRFSLRLPVSQRV